MVISEGNRQCLLLLHLYEKTRALERERKSERNSENSAGARPERNSDFTRSANALFTPHTSLKWSSRKVNAILFFIRYTLIYHFSIHEMASVVHRFLHCSFARAALHQ